MFPRLGTTAKTVGGASADDHRSDRYLALVALHGCCPGSNHLLREEDTMSTFIHPPVKPGTEDFFRWFRETRPMVPAVHVTEDLLVEYRSTVVPPDPTPAVGRTYLLREDAAGRLHVVMGMA